MVSGPKFTKLFSQRGRKRCQAPGFLISDINPFRRYLRSKWEGVRNWAKFSMFLAPFFLGGWSRPPNFWTGIIKFNMLLSMCQNFAEIGWGTLEISRWNKNKETTVKHRVFSDYRFGRPNKWPGRTHNYTVFTNSNDFSTSTFFLLKNRQNW